MIKLFSNTQIEQKLGERLRTRRLDLNISQEEAAERSGLSRRTISTARAAPSPA